MKKKINIILIIIGVLLICYPLIGRFLSKLNHTSAIEKYIEKVTEMDEDEKDELEKLYKNNKIENTEEVQGYIEIEKINVFLPIYEGTTDEVLLKGIGHLENTDWPLADEGYHAVFVGHTGITSKIFFDDLTKLDVNDYFSITILDDVYNYKICDIKKVLPSETDSLMKKNAENERLVTLITCTPKYVNSHRLLVTGNLI